MIDLSQYSPESVFSLIHKEIPEAPHYIEPSILPKGGKLLFGGSAKLGKSFMGLSLGRALALGVPLFDVPYMTVPEPTRVLMIEQELGIRTLQKRCIKIFDGDSDKLLKENFHVMSQLRGFKIDDPNAIDFLDRAVHECGAQVLILDPMGKLHNLDENDSKDMNFLFNQIELVQKRCEDLNLSVVMSHHSGKPSRDPNSDWDSLNPYNFRGSAKWFDEPDVLITGNRILLEDGGGVGPLDKNGVPEGWKAELRFTLRHGNSVPDMMIHINENVDFRVKYAGPRKAPGIANESGQKKKAGAIEFRKMG